MPFFLQTALVVNKWYILFHIGGVEVIIAVILASLRYYLPQIFTNVP